MKTRVTRCPSFSTGESNPMRQSKENLHPQFEITEQQHEIPGLQDFGERDFWRRVRDAAVLLERRVGEVQKTLNTLEQAQDEARRKFFLELIEEIMDNLDGVISTTDGGSGNETAQRWVKRFRIVRRKMEEILGKEKVVAIDLVSAPPGVVTIDGVEERLDVPDGTIVSVNWRGYLWRGGILRKASVTVAKNSRGSAECEGHEDGRGKEWQK